MDFASQQRNPAKHVVSLAAVILLHVFVVYALVSGLARKVVDVIRAPIETKVIEEIVKQPPPPEIPLPPPPKMEAPPPPFIPPPEVQIQAPPQPAPTISVQSHTPPPATDIRPVAPVVEAPKTNAPVSIKLACPTQVQPVMPRKAVQEGISGSVTAKVTIRGGKVVNVEIIKAQPRGVYESAVRSAMMQYQCNASGDQDVIAIQEFEFKLE
jgi:protein TonB